MTTPAAAQAAAQAAVVSALQAGVPAAEAAAFRQRLEQLERSQPADLQRDQALLAGVWELRWSSGGPAYLSVAPWLANLQILDPAAGRAMNLLRLAGPLGAPAAIAVRARIAVLSAQRVSVAFERGGWLGPRLGPQRLALLIPVKQPFPAWLDITVLTPELRICRGNAGTLFALLRRPDLSIASFLD
ncbi:MAG: PAP/fibrillin family protein [Cyanobacteriota bacterium]|nr:PAP/fibrillin family protein [Cyanobacteriota bacterium]